MTRSLPIPIGLLVLAFGAAPALADPPQRSRQQASPTARVQSANRDALREPTRAGYLGAVQVYPYSEGTLYRLYAAPERVTDIALQPGEAVTAVAAGDTLRWIVGDTSSGSGPARRTHILVKPSSAGLRTNLVITTDRRVYHLQLESTRATAMAALSWTYPHDGLIALQRSEAAAEAAVPVATGLAVENLRFGYRIDGDNPPWRPLRAFDDGRQTFIEFPPTIAQGEAPPLFVLSERGEAELVNYRMAGRYYVVDRLFARAELRLGARRQSVVRISRDDAARRAQRRRRPS
ncbi:MAG: P-type conjugative transfer protein TrbG [Sphingosinicella sp.]|uniref:P-type conjugative transfer protein TrbG n=1 Tax=Sphingosinicella sp. TaxID=1917971 RepID=UPI00403787CC